jgi:hypothetical protein
MLIRSLGSVFAGLSFTSRQVAAALHTDYTATSKALWKLRKSNLVATIATLPRRWGGYENLYWVSSRGWKKIQYLKDRQGAQAGSNILTSESVSSAQENSLLLGASRAEVQEYCARSYLTTGKGTADEYAALGIPSTTYIECPPIKKVQNANVNEIMIGLDHRFTVVEGTCIILRDNGFTQMQLSFQLTGLRAIGLMPSNVVCPQAFAMAARYLGKTDEEIIISLLVRRGIEQNKRIAELQATKESLMRTNESYAGVCRQLINAL